jgi:hypothetical protein
VQRRLLQVLAPYSPDLEFSTGLATRSTLGPCTLTVRPVGGDVDLESIALWLGRDENVDVAVPKHSLLHVRLKTSALRDWLRDGDGETPATPPPAPLTVAVPVEASPCLLECSRKAAVARSVAALLEGQGHVVGVTASVDEHVWLWETEPSAGQKPQRIDVAEVDARHDRLRARHGGILTLEDLRADIREDAITLEGRKRSDRYVDALVACLMTHVPRERRLGLDDQKVRRKLTELDEILAIREVAREKREAEGASAAELSEQAEPMVQGLIGQIEAATDVPARAARSLDPAPVNRLLRSLALEMRTAEALPAGDPLWAASCEALENALQLVAPGAGPIQS